MRSVLSFLIAWSSIASTALGQATPPAQPFVVGLSPYLDKSVKDEVYQGLVRLLVETLPLNSTLDVYDAFEFKSITHLSLPNARVFQSPKTRANQFAGAIGEVKRFLASDRPRPAYSNLNFTASIRVPQFLDFLAANLTTTNPPAVVMLVGSPLYQDAKEPAFSMADGYFPSDGHLQTTREKSIFGFSNQPDPARIVHWIYFGDPWVSDLHQEKVTRFWTLYLARRGAQLTSFSADLPSVMRSFARAETNELSSAKGWALDPTQTKVEMLRISRTVDVADWLTRDGVNFTAQRPPKVMIGPMKIGIRWKYNIDLDLYATPARGAETLFFQHTRSPEGYYYKDHRSSPGREYEFIEFETPVDIREVEAAVNFYKGSCPGGPRGEVRIEFDGRIYGGHFAIEASEGNLGRSGRSQAEYWVPIPVQEILKIAPVAAAR